MKSIIHNKLVMGKFDQHVFILYAVIVEGTCIIFTAQ